GVARTLLGIAKRCPAAFHQRLPCLPVAELDQEIATGPRVRLLERTTHGQRRGVQEEAVATRARQRSGGACLDGDVVTLGDAEVDPEALNDEVVAVGNPTRTLAVVDDVGTSCHDPGLAGAR